MFRYKYFIACLKGTTKGTVILFSIHLKSRETGSNITNNVILYTDCVFL